MNNNQPKRGRGRPKGGNSFTNVTLAQLSEYFGEQQAIPVSRVWLEKMNLTPQDAQQTIQAQPTAATSTAIDMTLEA